MPTGPKLDLVDGEAKSSVRANADKIMKSWLEGFEKALKQEPLDLDGLFIEESWMKDALALSWDLRTLQGRSKITQYVRDHGGRNGLFNLKIPQTSSLRPTLREIGPMTWLESAFDFETKVGQGRGVLRLANTALGEWKAWILFVKLTELRGDPRRYGLNRARYRNQQPLVPQEADDKTQPVVVVIGGGHCGLAAAACLQDQGISTLIIDREQRAGDSWRKRYKRLTAHSPNWADSMPFLEFPSNWPVFPDKDQLADFLEFYSRTLDLQIWQGTEFESAQYNDKLGRWNIETIGKDGERRRLRPRHLIYAGNAHVRKYPVIPTFQGQDEFKGLLYHATDHTDAATMPNIRSKKVVVIGSATTAHDICQDFVEAGADVTMIQRNSTFVLSTEAAAQIALPPPEEGLTFDDYILGFQSLPTFVLLGMMSGVTAHMLQYDSQLIEALGKTEFLVARGEDGQSFFSRGIMRRGGFYVNEGASDSIVSGKIKVMRCTQGVKQLTATGIILADDRSADADIIVLATGWKMFEDVKTEIMGESVIRCTNRTWGVDKEGEQGSVYRPTGHPGFWVAMSNFIGSKMGAPLLALQIKAREEGIDSVSPQDA